MQGNEIEINVMRLFFGFGRFSFSNRFYGVMVSTPDFESGNPSSNLGRTFTSIGNFTFFGNLLFHAFYIFAQ